MLFQSSECFESGPGPKAVTARSDLRSDRCISKHAIIITKGQCHEKSCISQRNATQQMIKDCTALSVSVQIKPGTTSLPYGILIHPFAEYNSVLPQQRSHEGHILCLGKFSAQARSGPVREREQRPPHMTRFICSYNVFLLVHVLLNS